MTYMTVKQAADKWGITVRRVQQYCADGVLQDVQRWGRAWMIPETAVKPAAEEDRLETDRMLSRRPMPLMAGSFLPGEAMTYIADISDKEEMMIAQAELCYFRGHCTQAALLSGKLTDHKDLSVRMSALLIHAFASIQQLRIHTVRQDFLMIKREMERSQVKRQTPAEAAVCAFVAAMKDVLLHNTKEAIPEIPGSIRRLPEGIRLYACYGLAHLYYLKGDYRRSLGIAETGLLFAGSEYMISYIYLNLVMAMNLMGLKQTEKAKVHFMKAWDMAKPDGFIEPFGEHHGLLYGLVETCLQKNEPEYYNQIVRIVYAFSEGWRRIHNTDMQESVTSELTAGEFSVAMLASKGWTNKEIAVQMNMTVNSVSEVIRVIYQKLNVKGRKELKKYMLR